MRSFTAGILVSGNLGKTCLQQLLNEAKVNFVFTDKNSDSIITLCNEKQIPVFVGNPRNGRAIDFLSKFNTDVILSINYLFIIEEDMISHAKLFAINFHGSLLPRYRGRTPHVWAIINNEKETGITAHLIAAGCDEGAIIYQEKFPISEHATGSDLLGEFNNRYPIIITKVMDMIENQKINPENQDESKATYFGKRTPNDGCIDWNWQKERIYNWVRAQAKPYPGAFTYFEGIKLIVHKIEFCDSGFHQLDKNGKIIDIQQGTLIVKCPNGAIKLTEIDTNSTITFQKGIILNERH